MSYPQQPQQPQDPNNPSAGQVPQAGPPQAGQVPSWQNPPAAPTAPTGGEYGAYGSFTGPADQRPGGVTAAAIMTWVGSALLVVIGLFMLGASGMSAELQDAGLPSELIDMMPAFGGLFLVIGIAAIVLAVLAFRRSKVGLYGLLVLGAIYLIMSIVGMVSGAGGGGVVGLIWVALASGLLIKNRSWFDGRPVGTI